MAQEERKQGYCWMPAEDGGLECINCVSGIGVKGTDIRVISKIDFIRDSFTGISEEAEQTGWMKMLPDMGEVVGKWSRLRRKVTLVILTKSV